MGGYTKGKMAKIYYTDKDGNKVEVGEVKSSTLNQALRNAKDAITQRRDNAQGNTPTIKLSGTNAVRREERQRQQDLLSNVNDVNSIMNKLNINSVKFLEQFRRWEDKLNKSTDKEERKQLKRALQLLGASIKHGGWEKELEIYNGDVRKDVWKLTEQAEKKYDELVRQYHMDIRNRNKPVSDAIYPDQYAPVSTFLKQ